MASNRELEDDSEEEYNGVDEGEEEDEDFDGGAQKKKQKRKSVFVDDAAEDDGDADEEDDEEDDDEGAPKRGQKRLKRSRFVDDIAAVDEEEDDEEEEDGVEDLIHDEGEELHGDEEDVVPRLEREAAFRQAAPRDDLSPEELEKFVNERYKAQAADLDVGQDVATNSIGRQGLLPWHADPKLWVIGDAQRRIGSVGQQGLLPRHADPKLWVMETRGGEEREAVVKLMQKAVNMAAAGTPLAITSVFAQDHLRGYIYIEAYKESHVKDAVRGLRNIYTSKAPKLVPIKEMVDAITVNRKAKAMIDVGSWVRVRTQLYKGDLAKVVDIDLARGQAEVKLVPRLDYVAMAKARAEGGAANRFGRQAPGAVRPAARAFSHKEANDARLPVEQLRKHDSEGFFYRIGDRRFEDGYLFRSYNVRNLSLEEGVPPLEELQRFNQVGVAARAADADNEGGELAQLMEALGDDERAAGGTKFGRDDRVIVMEGELKTLIGRVMEVKDDGFVRIMPLLEGLEELDLPARQLQKYFQAGDHVKVNSGQHEGQTGMVVRVEDPVCVLVSDATHEELQVFARDLTESSEAATGLDSFGNYELHDLMMLDDGSVGVLIAVAKDSCKVLTNKSTPEQQRVRVCRALDIKRKVDNFRSISTVDATRKQIGVGDIVDVAAGRAKGKSGTVKYIHRQGLFLHVRELMDNGGFIYMPAVKVRARGKAAAGLSAGVKAGVIGGAIGRSPAYQSNGSATPMSGAYGQPGPGAGRGRGHFPGRGGGRSGPDSRMIDRMVTIIKGPLRGYKGRIKNVTDREVRIELEAQARTVTVRRDQIPPEDGGAPMPARMPFASAGGATPAYGGMRTPAHITATPRHLGAATPMHPGMTPSHPGAATPGRDNAWVPVMATPAHPSLDAGGRSDAWAPVMSTPRHPPSESAWDPVRSSAAPAPVNTGRTSGWEKSHAQYGAPVTSIPKAGDGAGQGAWEPVAPAGLPPAMAPAAGAAQEIVFSTFEGIAVKLKDSGQFGVVRSVQGGLATVAIGTEDAEKGVVLGDAPASVMVGQASLEPLLPNVKGMPIKVIGGTQALGRHGHVLNLVESHEVIVKVGGSELKVLPRPFVAVLCLPSA